MDEERVHTGVAAVDAVIAAVDGLAQRPLAEHATVFESAQERLRRALDADPDAGAEADAGHDSGLDAGHDG